MESLRAVREFTRTLDQSNLRDQDQLAADLFTIYQNWPSTIFNSSHHRKFIRSLLEEITWIPNEDDEIILDDESVKSSPITEILLEMIQNRLRCIRAEIVSLGWKKSSDPKKFICFLLSWLLSIFIACEDSNFHLHRSVIPSIKNSKSTNDISAVLKRCLILVFVDAQSLLSVLCEEITSMKSDSLRSFALLLQAQLCERAFDYHTLIPQIKISGSDELSSCLKSIRQCWQLMEVYYHNSNNQKEISPLIAPFEVFSKQLVNVNQRFHICFASEIGFPIVFRPPPDDEKIAREKMF
jgi:hypothetical protein